jgi:hypothetical protein
MSNIGPKVQGYKPAEDDGFLRAIKIDFLRRGSKVVGPCRKIVQHAKEPCVV